MSARSCSAGVSCVCLPLRGGVATQGAWELETASPRHSSSSTAALVDAKGACRRMAAVLSAALESEKPGSAGAQPGEERFTRIMAALAKAGELYPHLERGLPGRLHFIQIPQQQPQPSPAANACASSSFVQSDASDPSNAALKSNGKQTRVRESFPGEFKNRERLDHMDWCKAAQIWLLELAGDWREVETICWRPGLWGASAARRIEQCADRRRLRDHLAAFLLERGQARAGGLLLASLGKPERALEVWMEEYYVQSSASHDRHGALGHEVRLRRPTS